MDEGSDISTICKYIKLFDDRTFRMAQEMEVERFSSSGSSGDTRGVTVSSRPMCPGG
jgi:hypothetical protein